ncbi:MAG TPA: Clp protease N-terminal domain-containing protein, partial [Isosphaeraceae bacterium]
AGITPGHIQLLFQESLQDRSIGDVYAFLDAAEAKAKEDGLDAIDSGHLLEVLMEKGKDGPVREILARLGLNPEQVRDRVKEVRRQMHPEERNPLQESPRPRGADPEGHGA